MSSDCEYLAQLAIFLGEHATVCDDCRQYSTAPFWFMVNRQDYITAWSPAFLEACHSIGLAKETGAMNGKSQAELMRPFKLAESRFHFPDQHKLAQAAITKTFSDGKTQGYLAQYTRPFGDAEAGDFASHRTIYCPEQDSVVLAWKSIKTTATAITADQVRQSQRLGR